MMMPVSVVGGAYLFLFGTEIADQHGGVAYLRKLWLWNTRWRQTGGLLLPRPLRRSWGRRCGAFSGHCVGYEHKIMNRTGVVRLSIEISSAVWNIRNLSYDLSQGAQDLTRQRHDSHGFQLREPATLFCFVYLLSPALNQSRRMDLPVATETSPLVRESSGPESTSRHKS